MNGARTIGAYALRECLRRRVFAVVLVLTVVFLALYSVGTYFAFDQVEHSSSVAANVIEERVLAGSTLLGLAMFTTLFLGSVLAVFLTLGAVRGDDERGLLAPLVVRPVGRAQFLLGRFTAAAVVCAPTSRSSSSLPWWPLGCREAGGPIGRSWLGSDSWPACS